ncbi:MFS transporter [Providencia rettgeri]|uniref:MFS transporter n=1 Tax=Providencia TaxID=586 RepID=UPI001419127E|nr:MULTISPECIES: MFS transporter [Providencia]MBQ0208231.1 MFS transporter [Providencia rettgeri]MDR9613592.1 MFS transporter [Providencia rettgeri]MDU7492481.1 MFS transporter [Providencia rettgeri]NIA72808.1 MFS transporter [Providencia rettgeri]NIA76953.1 MFS transporter [Providencia rettgeri]
MTSNRNVLFLSAVIVYLVGTTEFMLSSIMSPLALAFEVPSEQIPWLISSYALAYTLTAPLIGYLSDRIDKRKILLTAILLLSLDSLAIIFSPNFSVAVIFRVIGGVASAALVPVIFSLIADVIKRENQAAAMGSVMMGMTVGIVTGPMLAGILVQYFSWYSPFILTSLCGLFAFSISWFILPSSKKNHTYPHSLSCLIQANILRLIIAKGLWNGVSVSIFLLSGEIIRQRTALETAEIGIIMGLFGIGLFIGNALVAKIAKYKLQDAAKLILILLGILVALVLFITGKLPLVGDCICLLFIGVALGVASPVSTSLLAKESTKNKGLVLSVSESINNLALLITIPAFSLLVTENNLSTLVLSVILIISSAIFLVMATLNLRVRKNRRYR